MTHLAAVQTFAPALPVMPIAAVANSFDDIFAKVTTPTLELSSDVPVQPPQKQAEQLLNLAAAIATQNRVAPQAPPASEIEPATQTTPHDWKLSDETQTDLGSEAEKVKLEQQPQPDPQVQPATHSVASLPNPVDLPKLAKPKRDPSLFTNPAQANLAEVVTVADNRPIQLPAVPQAAPPIAQAASPVFEVPVAAQTLDILQDALWIDTLARDISASAATDGKLQFRLLPEFLGKLDVALTHKDDRLDIAMQASTEAAARIISADQSRLIEELRQSGVRVGNFDMFSGQHNGAPKQQSPQPATPQRSVEIESKPERQRGRDGRFA